MVHAKVSWGKGGGSWDKQIEELIYARGLPPRAPVASVTGSGGKFLHSPAPAQCNRAGPWLHRKNLRGTHLQLQRRRGFVNSNRTRTRTSTSTADGTPIWHPGASGRARWSESSSMPRDLDTSDYQTPHPRLMRGCIQVRYAFQILRYAAAVHPESRQHFCPDTQLWRYK